MEKIKTRRVRLNSQIFQKDIFEINHPEINTQADVERYLKNSFIREVSNYVLEQIYGLENIEREEVFLICIDDVLQHKNLGIIGKIKSRVDFPFFKAIFTPCQDFDIVVN